MFDLFQLQSQLMKAGAAWWFVMMQPPAPRPKHWREIAAEQRRADREVSRLDSCSTFRRTAAIYPLAAYREAVADRRAQGGDDGR